MTDIFDRLLNKFISGSSEKRTKQVIFSSLMFLALFAAAFAWLSFFTLNFSIRAKGEVIDLGNDFCPVIKIMIEPMLIDQISIGYEVIVANSESGRQYKKEFAVNMINKDESYVLAFCRKEAPIGSDLEMSTKVDAQIIYDKQKIIDVLLKREGAF